SDLPTGLPDAIVPGLIDDRWRGYRHDLTVERGCNAVAAIVEGRQVPPADESRHPGTVVRVRHGVGRALVAEQHGLESGYVPRPERIELRTRLPDVVVGGERDPERLEVEPLTEVLGACRPLRDAHDLELGQYVVPQVAGGDHV